jgi:hypothetical protein
MLPLIGTVQAVVLSVTPVSIHGDTYIDLLVQTREQAGTASGSRFRVPTHALADGREPAPGSVVELQLLMQQVTALRILGDATPGGQ